MACSYCHCQGHNIRLCNDPTIITHYNNIKGIYISIPILSRGAWADERFRDSVSRYNVSILKAVVAKFVGGVISLLKSGLILRLWNWFKLIIPNVLENEWIERVTLPTIPDVIPSYAQDLSISNGTVVPEFGPGSISFVQSSVQRSGTRVFELLRNARALLRNTNTPQVIAIDAILEEYVAFSARNLAAEFERINIPKKYNISTCISVTETSEELEKCEDCSICFEETKLLDTVTINCGHKFCGTCITNTLKMYNNMSADPACAFCRSQMTSFVVKNPEIYSLVSEHCIM